MGLTPLEWKLPPKKSMVSLSLMEVRPGSRTRLLRKYDLKRDMCSSSRFAVIFSLSGQIANGTTRFVASCLTR